MLHAHQKKWWLACVVNQEETIVNLTFLNPSEATLLTKLTYKKKRRFKFFLYFFLIVWGMGKLQYFYPACLNILNKMFVQSHLRAFWYFSIHKQEQAVSILCQKLSHCCFQSAFNWNLTCFYFVYELYYMLTD